MELDNIKKLRATVIEDLAGYTPPIESVSLGLYADEMHCRWSMSGWLHFIGTPEFISGYGATIDDAKRELVRTYKRKLKEFTIKRRIEQELAVIEE